MIRRTGQVFGLLIVMIALCLLLLAILPSAWLARQVAAMASGYLELSVEMDALHVAPFSLTPTVTIEGLNIMQSPDSVRFRTQEASASLTLPALFMGELLLDRLRISDAGLDARIDEQGHGNWQTSDAEVPADTASLLQSLLAMKIDDLVLDSFNVHLVNAQFDTEFSVDVDAVASTFDASKLTRGHVEGHANDQAVTVDAEFAFLGDILKLPAAGDSPVSIDVMASVGDDRISLKGSVGDPASMREVDAVFSARISSLEHWQGFVPIRLPDLPSLALDAELTRDDKEWRLRYVDGRFGNTDFSGEVSVDTSSRPVTLDARLMSAQLAFDELMQLQWFELLPLQINGSIDYRAEHVVSDTWPLDEIDLLAVLDDRQLSVLINRIRLRGGELEGEIIRELQSQPVVTQIRLNLKRLDLQQILPASDDDSPRFGQLASRIELSVAGETQASMRSSANGVMIMLMTGEWLDTVLEAVFGVELARSLMVDRDIPGKARKQCAFLELQATDGVVQVESLVLDTDAVVYLGDGEIDWKNQSIDLTIEPHFKKVQADADAAHAVYVSGALSAPVVESVHPFLNRETAVSVLGATITPAVALMPFLNEKSDRTNDICQGMASALDDPK